MKHKLYEELFYNHMCGTFCLAVDTLNYSYLRRSLYFHNKKLSDQRLQNKFGIKINKVVRHSGDLHHVGKSARRCRLERKHVQEFLGRVSESRRPAGFGRRAESPRFDLRGPIRLALLNSLFKVLFNFPSQYLFAIGLVVIFSLRWSLPPA